MAVYGKATKTENDLFRDIYTVLTYVSGVLYFMSTCINPLLYSIMSHKFRDAFKVSSIVCFCVCVCVCLCLYLVAYVVTASEH